MNDAMIYWLTQSLKDLPSGREWLHPSEQELAEGYNFPKKRNDYLLGRWTAKIAVQSFLQKSHPDINLADIEIRRAVDGAPEVYSFDKSLPVHISLSHSHGIGLCTISSSGNIHGCDVEYIEPRSDAFISDYLTREERNILAEYSDRDKPLIANLLWSAKEGTMKLLRTGLSIDTRKVMIPFIENKNFQEWNNIRIIYSPEEKDYYGYWHTREKFIYLIVTESPENVLVELK